MPRSFRVVHTSGRSPDNLRRAAGRREREIDVDRGAIDRERARGRLSLAGLSDAGDRDSTGIVILLRNNDFESKKTRC